MATDAQQNQRPSTTDFLKAAKDFSYEQKLSVIQSILGSIPREQQQPWHLSKALWEKEQRAAKLAASTPGVQTVSGGNVEITEESVDTDLFKEGQEKPAITHYKPKAPPLIDPYERSMRYYEKHLILNNFQHMTAKLVLHRPENALQLMIDWCKERQKECQAEELKSKALYEENKIDVYDEDILKPLSSSAKKQEADSSNTRSYGNSLLKQATAKSEPMTPDETAGGDSIRVQSNTDQTHKPKSSDSPLPHEGDTLRPVSQSSSHQAKSTKSSEPDLANADDNSVSVSDAADGSQDEEDDFVSVSTTSDAE